ncbi:MAG: hotdog fold domain-containing protein [Woeseiaceae bacterium]
MSRWPAGQWLFSRAVCFKAPYFASIRPQFVELRPGYSVVTMRKRRRVRNHIGTVHAIAMCNLAEIAAGTVTEVSMPPHFRWIPKGMTVRYLAKAQTDLKAVAVIDPMPSFENAEDVPVRVTVTDTSDQVVFSANITMYISPRRSEP